MLIKDATNQYNSACAAAEGQPPFEDLLRQLIDSGYSENFENDSYFDALWLTHHMLKRSHRQISMLTGSAGDGFYSTLAAPFEDAMQRIQATNGKVRMVILNQKGDVPSFLSEMKRKFAGAFDYVLAQTTAPIGHFIVCDSRMVRIEEPHDDITQDSPASLIKAKVNFNAPTQAAIKESFFNTVWQRLKNEPKSLKASV